MKNTLCLCLLLAVLFSVTAFGETAKSGAGQKKEEEEYTLRLEKKTGLPKQEWQKDAVFPDWKGYTDDTLAMNSMLSFRMYHGQGKIWLKVSGEVESFSLYVNGEKCDTAEAGGGIWEADISTASVDGVNTLQLSNILPSGLEGAVEVFIPWPEVLDGAESIGGTENLEGINGKTLDLISDIIETVRGSIDSVNIIIFVLIILAGALAFIVLYNLTNINVGERVREIATLKVLGFRAGETNAYIFLWLPCNGT